MTAVAKAPIAIVGVSALFPGSSRIEGFWQDVLHGVDRVGDVPERHWLVSDYYDEDPSAPDKTYAKRGAFLDPVDFDPIAFGIPPAMLRSTDTSQLLALIVAQQVLQDAWKEQFDTVDRSRVSVILGVTSGQELFGHMVSRLQRPVWVKALREAGLPESKVEDACERIASHYVPWEESSFPGLLGNVVAGRVANRLNLGGTNCVTDAACASAFSALSMGLSELWLGDSDLVVAGGVDTMNDIFMYMCFSKTPALSPTGDARPFSDRADGTLLGEGLGMVALKRLADAERDGDEIYAVIRGIGSSSDGRAKSVYAPLPEGQARAIRRAYESASFAPATVELVEAHGTGTKAGDAAEFRGLTQVFERGDAPRPWIALGSAKSQFGHTKAAAGVAGLLKAALALRHGVLPPTLKVDRPNPKLGIEASAFYLNTASRPWVRDATHPRRAGVSSFGFGGTNFHVALEEPPGELAAARFDSGRAYPLWFGAADAARLAATLNEAADALQEHGSVAWASYASLDAYAPGAAWRAGAVATSVDEAVERLRAAAAAALRSESAWQRPDGVWVREAPVSGRVAALCAGQGAQYVGMGDAIACAFPEALRAWDRCASLRWDDDLALQHVVFPPPAFDDDAREQHTTRLTATEWAQPAIGVATAAALDVLDRFGLRFDAYAGHSFGEVSALHAAGAFDRDTFVRVARERGERMAEAARTRAGAMLAVEASAEDLRPFVDATTGVVIANENSPRQTVLSGDKPTVEALARTLESSGRRVRRLPVATAFHSPIVAGACAPFSRFLAGQTVRAPQATVYANTSAAPYPSDPDALRDLLSEQVARPVRYASMIQQMADDGVRVFVEVGPRDVQTRLVREILSERDVVCVHVDRRGKDGVRQLAEALTELAVAGVNVDPLAWWRGMRVPLDPTGPAPRLTVALDGANHENPYPPAGGSAALPPPNPEPVRRRAPMTDPNRPPAPTASAPASDASRPTPAPATAPSPTAPAPAANAEVQLAWVHAFEATQRRLMEAHNAWQSSMTATHAAFLQTAESAFAGLGQILGGDPSLSSPQARIAPRADQPAPVRGAELPPALAPPYESPPQAAAPRPATTQPTPTLSASTRPLAATPSVTSAPAFPWNTAPSPAPPSPAQPAPATPVGHAPQPALAPQGPDAAEGLEPTLLGVVAEKTGYPVDMLGLEMALEADLGIDSIKRVEILSALQEAVPCLPDVDGDALAELRTLGDIVAALTGAHDGSAPASSAGAIEPMSAPAGADHGGDLSQALLQVVADKTGYPVDMLGLEMGLEADLGIDSIKRVEILSALQDAHPELNEVDGDALAQLRTLGDIVHALTSGESATSEAPPANPSEGRLAPTETPERPSTPLAPQHASLASAAAIETPRWALRTVPAPSLEASLPGLEGVIALLDDGTPFGRAIEAELRSRGARVRRHPHSAPSDASAVLDVRPTGPFSLVGQAIATNERVFASAVALSQLAGRPGTALESYVVVTRLGGDHGLAGADPVAAWASGCTGLAKTAAQEWPDIAVRCIDLPDAHANDDACAALLVAELYAGGTEREIALRSDGSRWTIDAQREAAPQGAPWFASDDVIVVSGGARGVTASCIVALARETGASFALLGRTPLKARDAEVDAAADDAALKSLFLARARARGETPSPADIGRAARGALAQREIRDTIAAVAVAGGRAHYVAADVTSASELSRALREVRDELGAPTGLVHGAGVLADRRLAEKTGADFERVFGTKVLGLRALLHALRDDPLHGVVLFGSVAGRAGNVGQADYAMANEVLSKVGAAECAARGGTTRFLTLAWGPWDGGMVDDALRRRFEAAGVFVIPRESGAAAFCRELRQGERTSREVVFGSRPLGRALAGGDTRRSFSWNAEISPERDGFLADHAIDDTPVVPFALAVEWMHRAARGADPDRNVALEDLQVLRPLRLDAFESGPHRFEVVAMPDAQGASLQVRDAGGTVFYQGRARYFDERPSSAWTPRELSDDGDASPGYGGVLFHGPDFHLIVRVRALAPEGAAADVRGVHETAWPTRTWFDDVAWLDSGLQLALLWTERVLGGPSVPMSVGRYVPGGPPSDGPKRVELISREAKGAKAVCDLGLIAADGSVVGVLEGVTTYTRPAAAR